jgi:hypothetical protein
MFDIPSVKKAFGMVRKDIQEDLNMPCDSQGAMDLRHRHAPGLGLALRVLDQTEGMIRAAQEDKSPESKPCKKGDIGYVYSPEADPFTIIYERLRKLEKSESMSGSDFLCLESRVKELAARADRLSERTTSIHDMAAAGLNELAGRIEQLEEGALDTLDSNVLGLLVARLVRLEDGADREARRSTQIHNMSVAGKDDLKERVGKLEDISMKRFNRVNKRLDVLEENIPKLAARLNSMEAPKEERTCSHCKGRGEYDDFGVAKRCHDCKGTGKEPK